MEEVKKQIMHTLGQEWQVQRPWGRSTLSISENSKEARVAGTREAKRGKASWVAALWPIVMLWRLRVRKETLEDAEQRSDLTWFCSSRTREGQSLRGLRGDATAGDGRGLGGPRWDKEASKQR